MWRLVLDTNVVTAAFRSGSGASRALLLLAEERAFIPLASPALFLEYEAVLKRPEQRLISGLSLDDLDMALDALAHVSEPVTTRFQWRPQLPDPGDELVLEAAINGRADALVTFNTKDFAGVAHGFGLMLLSPAAALMEVR